MPDSTNHPDSPLYISPDSSPRPAPQYEDSFDRHRRLRIEADDAAAAIKKEPA